MTAWQLWIFLSLPPLFLDGMLGAPQSYGNKRSFTFITHHNQSVLGKQPEWDWQKSRHDWAVLALSAGPLPCHLSKKKFKQFYLKIRRLGVLLAFCFTFKPWSWVGIYTSAEGIWYFPQTVPTIFILKSFSEHGIWYRHVSSQRWFFLSSHLSIFQTSQKKLQPCYFMAWDPPSPTWTTFIHSPLCFVHHSRSRLWTLGRYGCVLCGKTHLNPTVGTTNWTRHNTSTSWW